MSGLSINVQRRIGNFALDVRLLAPRGVTGIIGPSGAGKSMLLQLIAGLQRPDHAHITFDDQVLNDSAKRISLPPERRRIGYVFQDALLFPHLSVAQNLDYGAKRRDASLTVSRDEVIALLGLDALLARRPHHLSGGEAQRVSIGRALLSGPRLLLMDEPLSGLDPRRRAGIMPFIEVLNRRLDLPILYVSHNIDEITRLADRVVVLHQGSVAASGDVAAVLNRPEIQRLILGDSDDTDPAAIIEARVEAHDEAAYVTTLVLGADRISLPLVSDAVGSIVRLRVHARDVAIATERPQGISIQNILEATITEIAPTQKGQVDLTLSLTGAHMLKARITKRAHDALVLAPDRKVWVLIKSVALVSTS
ncbi:MAG: molybdenum ABC transporter ATP-binding protein [Parvibaculum sp.]|nr:molybdenum ABC transporter ATP-binding protein [Parvibaculum sp.]